jgi:4-amino-4-deoxy-L-arabinose transferase-like glycosyltransferase
MTLLSDERAGGQEHEQLREPDPLPDGARPEPFRRARLPDLVQSLPTSFWLGATLVLGLIVRLANLNAFGFNSDEAVYGGQSASLAGNPLFVNQFPVFRAHPLLLPTLLSPLFSSGTPDLRGRVVVALFGVATIGAVYLIGRELYGPKTGVVAALILAVMPYHLVVTRQLLLDGPATLWVTLSIWMLARFVRTDRLEWLAASAATLGLAVLTKETAIVLAGSVIIFLLLSTEVRRPGRAVALTLGVLIAMSLVRTT